MVAMVGAGASVAVVGGGGVWGVGGGVVEVGVVAVGGPEAGVLW